METGHPFSAHSILPISEKNSECAISQANLVSNESKESRVNFENMFPAEQSNFKLMRHDDLSCQSNKGRFGPYAFPSSRDREERGGREDQYRYRADNTSIEGIRREERSSSKGNYSYDPSYYCHNRRAGADAEEFNFENNTSLVSTTLESNRRSEDNGPPPIVISRDPDRGSVLMRSGGANFSSVDKMFSYAEEREARPKLSDDFGHSRSLRECEYPSSNLGRVNRTGSSHESANKNRSHRDYRNNNFSYFARSTDSKDHSSRDMRSFDNFRSREWERDRCRDRDRQRWERHRDRDREWNRYKGRQRWDSERVRERDRERDISSNRPEQRGSYRDREYLDEDVHRRGFYRDFRRETTIRDTYDCCLYSRDSHTPERRGSSVESTRYPGRFGSSRGELLQSQYRSKGELDRSKHSSYTKHNPVSTERSFHEEYYEKLHQDSGIALTKSNRTVTPSKMVFSNELQDTPKHSEPSMYDNKSEHMNVSLETCSTSKAHVSTQNMQEKSKETLQQEASVVSVNELPSSRFIDNHKPLEDGVVQKKKELAGKNAKNSAINEATLECQSQRSPCTDQEKMNKPEVVNEALPGLDEVATDQPNTRSTLEGGFPSDPEIGADKASETKRRKMVCEASKSDISKKSKGLEVQRVSSLHEAKARFEILEKATCSNGDKDTVTTKETKSEGGSSISLTTEKIFAMIDHIDSEIGHYEALLGKVRTNKQSCIENDLLEVESSNAYLSSLHMKQENADLIEPILEVSSTYQGATRISANPLKPGQLTRSCDELKSQKIRKPPLYQQIYAENQALVRKNIKPFLGPVYKNIESYPFYFENIQTHKKIRNLMFTRLKLEANALEKKKSRLRQEYKEHLDDWRNRISKLDKKRERKRSKKINEDELLTSNISGITSRSHRRGGFYNADAVRSEAELMEIIQYLEHEDLRNPDIRSIRTAATIPAMILDPNKRELAKYDNRNNLVEDPYNYYHCGKSVDRWTSEERDIFIKKYLLFPKQFGKIASFLKNKDPKQCVLFYYREKKLIDFKGLISGRGKKRPQLGRKGTGKRAGRKKKSKGNALLQDIDEAERSTQISEDPPDSSPDLEKKRPRGFDNELTLPESQKSRRKSRAKQRQNSSPVNDEENGARAASPPPSTARWSEEDRLIALQAYKKFGQDFYSVSKVVGSKTEEQCRNFYYNFRRKYGMSALEAPLEMTNERGAEIKPSSFSDDFSLNKLDRKQKTFTESLQSESKQHIMKHKNSEIRGNSSMEKDLNNNELRNTRSQTAMDSSFTLESNTSAAPTESFLELLAQAALNQDAELSHGTDTITSSTSTLKSEPAISSGTSFDNGSIPSLKVEENTIDHLTSQYPCSNPNPSGLETLSKQQYFQMNFSESFSDSGKLSIDLNQPTNPPSTRKVDSISQGRQPINSMNAFSLLNLAAEEHAKIQVHQTAPRQWSKEDTNHSAPAVLDFLRTSPIRSLGQKSCTPNNDHIRAQDIYCIKPKAHSFESSIPSQHPVQDNIIEHRVEHKAVEQRETQPIQQLQLLQIQSPPISASQSPSQATPHESHSHSSFRANLSRHSTRSSLSPSPLHDPSGHSIEIHQAARPSALGNISTSQPNYHMPSTPQQTPEKPTTFTSSYSQPLHPPLHY